MASLPASLPPILAQLRHARAPREQIAVLRSLKDEVIGHIQQKEKWVEYGVLDPVVRVLRDTRVPSRSNGKEVRNHSGSMSGLGDEETARLQALQVLASFAKGMMGVVSWWPLVEKAKSLTKSLPPGGPSFLAPINAAGAVPVILSNTSPLENHPHIVLSALRVLNSVAEATGLSARSAEDSASLAREIFASSQLDSFHMILTCESTSPATQEQKTLVMALISRLCKDSRHQEALANTGILDALATLLASFVVERGEVVPGAEFGDESMAEWLPPPAPRGLKLTDTLAAISAVIEGSPFRACLLVFSPAIMAVFPSVDHTRSLQQPDSPSWNALEPANASTRRARSPGAMDYLLPVMPTCPSKMASSSAALFAPVAPSPASKDFVQRLNLPPWDQTSSDAASPRDEPEDDAESPLIPWLIHLVRSSTGLDRVLAASILASLSAAGLASIDRENTIGLVIVPIICRIMKEHDRGRDQNTTDSAFVKPDTALRWAIVERAPAVLARLVADSELLQQAAYESGVIETVCRLLKGSYDAFKEQSIPRPWTPATFRNHASHEGFAAQQMGPPGKLPAFAHRIRLREACLKLTASMLSVKDDYRKTMVDQDAMPYIVESLYPIPGKPRAAKDRPKAEKGAAINPIALEGGHSVYGNNPASVIIAAVHCVRVLARSVSITRTQLEDYGVATPIFSHLKHPDVTLQIAACATICNLTLDHSPMRTVGLPSGPQEARKLGRMPG